MRVRSAGDERGLVLLLAQMMSLVSFGGAELPARRGGRKVFVKRLAWRCKLLALLTVTLSAAGCEPPLEIGSWKCVAAPLFVPPDGSPILPGSETTVEPTWSTSFEDGFCGYEEARGFCYTDPDADYSIVGAPARNGRRAAAFTINTDEEKVGRQARCVREGFLPQDAYYGAWFYIPTRVTSNGNWNLMHFRGADEDTELRGLWDVSIETTDDGRMLPRLFKSLGPGPGMQATHTDVELPVAEWFFLQIRLKRDATAAGVAALYLGGYLEGQLVAELSDVITDDTSWGQWYVGNLADDLSPTESTIYVDDVTIQQSMDSDN